MLALKSVSQKYSPPPSLLCLMEAFRQMTNECIDNGLKNDVSTLKRLSKLCYTSLARYGTPSYYRLTAISRAAGILSARKKSLRRGRETKSPYRTAAACVMLRFQHR